MQREAISSTLHVSHARQNTCTNTTYPCHLHHTHEVLRHLNIKQPASSITTCNTRSTTRNIATTYHHHHLQHHHHRMQRHHHPMQHHPAPLTTTSTTNTACSSTTTTPTSFSTTTCTTCIRQLSEGRVGGVPDQCLSCGSIRLQTTTNSPGKLQLGYCSG